MRRPKLIVGVALVVLSAVLLALILLSVGANMAHTGPLEGKITSYRPPFESHGLWMVVLIILCGLSFLGGILLTAIGKRE